MFLKRCFDLFFTIPGLIMLTPLLIIVAVVIKIDSPGPVFFRQKRVGQFGRTFLIYKFRTMVVNAERIGKQITVGQDSRITGIGGFLRKYKLDELPQLINVLRGEMSLVGPRPEVPRYVAEYGQVIRDLILSVPPGITDLASIAFREENDILATAANPEAAYINEILPIKLAYCERYVKSRSLWFDLKLIIWTLATVLLKCDDRLGAEFKLSAG